MAIKYNLNNINEWYFSDDNIVKVYRNDDVIYQKIASGSTPPSPSYSGQYLTFVAQEDAQFSITWGVGAVLYSIDDGTTWTTLNSPTVSAGNKIMLKATLTPSSSFGIGIFRSTANFTVEGNPLSLLYGDNFRGVTDLTGYDYAFYNLFNGCTTLTSAENLSLPATTLADSCYSSMFYGCTSLTTAPNLPADTLASSCYKEMFSNCTSLTTAPSLPATTLVQQCYRSMFDNCTSLSSITCLATNISASLCTSNWVSNVSPNGTFTKAASMTSWTRGNKGIPRGWSVQDA